MAFTTEDCSLQTRTLCLHTDRDGCVWIGDVDEFACNSYLDVADFFQANVYDTDLTQANIIRVLGGGENAALIVKLQQFLHAGRGVFGSPSRRIQLVSPASILGAKVSNDPELVLHVLRQPGYSSCLRGAYHDLGAHEYTMYSMIAERNATGVSETVKRLAPYHPGWLGISFLSSYNMDAACELLCHIVDPRWYYHSAHERFSRLYAYLGLTPKNMQAFWGTGSPDRYYDRAAMAVRTWYAPNASVAPGSFLQATFDQYGRGWKALLRATQRLVRFVSLVWLYNVTPVHPEMSFDAVRFFGDRREALAYRSHVLRQKYSGK